MTTDLLREAARVIASTVRKTEESYGYGNSMVREVVKTVCGCPPAQYGLPRSVDSHAGSCIVTRLLEEAALLEERARA